MRRWARRLLFLLILVAVGGGVGLYYQDLIADLLQRGREATFGPPQEGGKRRAASLRKVSLFFTDAREQMLAPCPAEVEEGKDELETLRRVLLAYLRGPERPGYAPVLPKGTTLRAVLPGPGGAAYLDFDRTLRDAHPGGAWAEMLSAYGLANTVLMNFGDSFERVVLLVDGQEARTIAGAYAINGSLRARRDIVLEPEEVVVPPPAVPPVTKPPTTVPPAPPPAGPPSPTGAPGASLPPARTPFVGPAGAPMEGTALPPVGTPGGKPEGR